MAILCIVTLSIGHPEFAEKFSNSMNGKEILLDVFPYKSVEATEKIVR